MPNIDVMTDQELTALNYVEKALRSGEIPAKLFHMGNPVAHKPECPVCIGGYVATYMHYGTLFPNRPYQELQGVQTAYFDLAARNNDPRRSLYFPRDRDVSALAPYEAASFQNPYCATTEQAAEAIRRWKDDEEFVWGHMSKWS